MSRSISPDQVRPPQPPQPSHGEAASNAAAGGGNPAAPALAATSGTANAWEPWRWPLIGAVVILGLLILLFGQFFHNQWLWASGEQADWGHTLVVPFIAGYFVYLNRRKLLAQPFKTAWLGLIPLAGGVAIYLLGLIGPRALNHFNIQGFGLWMTLNGICLLLFGWRAMRYLWFPLLYLGVFGQTISYNLLNKITFRLQDITAVGAHIVLSLGMDVTRNGNTLTINDGGELKPLNIAEACSGMRMLVAFLALGVAMAFTGLQRNWQRVALILAAVPTAIAVNVLRVVTLGLLALWDAQFAAGDFHSFIGLVWLVPAFLIYLGLMWIIAHIILEDRPSKSAVDSASKGMAALRPRWGASAPWAFAAACVVLLASGAGFRYAVEALNIFLSKKPVELRGVLTGIPTTLGQWKAVGKDGLFTADIVDIMGTDKYLDRNYTIDGDPNRPFLKVHVAYYTGMIDSVPHVPERCFVAWGAVQKSESQVHPLNIDTSGWESDAQFVNLATQQPYQVLKIRDDFTGRERVVRMPVGEMSIRVTEFEESQAPGVRIFGGYFFIANGRVTSTAEHVRLMAFDLSDKFAYYCKVQFTYGSSEASLQEYLALVSDFVNHMLPELMQRLPDWSEVERRDAEAAPTAGGNDGA